MDQQRRERVRRASLTMMTGGSIVLGVMGIRTLPTLGEYVLPSIALLLTGWFFAAVIYAVSIPLKTGGSA